MCAVDSDFCKEWPSTRPVIPGMPADPIASASSQWGDRLARCDPRAPAARGGRPEPVGHVDQVEQVGQVEQVDPAAHAKLAEPVALGRGGSAAGSSLTHAEFAAEFGRAARALWCVAAGMTNDRSAADDIVQQAATTAIERLHDFERSTNFVAWMARIVRHAAMNELRKSRRRRTTSTDSQTLDHAAARTGAGVASSASARAANTVSRLGDVAARQTEFDDQLMAALDRLPSVARACLLLRVVLDVPYREIACVMEIPPGTAMSHVDRARRSLREMLGEVHDGSNRRGRA